MSAPLFRRNSIKMSAPLFRSIKSNIFVFEVIKHQYIAIHHTKNQAKNIFTSCGVLLLKTLFHFISHCIADSWLLGNELENYNFTFP